MSASPKTFFVTLPCPKCGEETWGAITMHVGEYIACFTDQKHYVRCGEESREQIVEQVERAYVEAGEPLKGVTV